RGGVGKAAPIGAELERHHHARHHAHAEGDGEQAQPEAGNAKIDVLAGEEIEAFQQGDVGGDADGESGQQYVPGDYPAELKTRQDHGIERHMRSLAQKPGPRPPDKAARVFCYCIKPTRCLTSAISGTATARARSAPDFRMRSISAGSDRSRRISAVTGPILATVRSARTCLKWENC